MSFYQVLNKKHNLHKNASFWTHLISNTLDFLIVFALLYINYFAFLKHEIVQKYSYYLFFIFSISILLIYFLIIPYFLNIRTFGVFIIRKQIIVNLLPIKWKKIKIIFFRYIFNFLYWAMIFLLFILFIKKEDFIEFKKILELIKEKQINLYTNKKLLFFYQIISILCSLWFLIASINYCLIIFKKNKLGLKEIISNTRMVDFKHFVASDLIKETIIYPNKITNKTFSYYEQESKEY